jgi:hypothetical protein
MLMSVRWDGVGRHQHQQPLMYMGQKLVRIYLAVGQRGVRHRSVSVDGACKCSAISPLSVGSD